MNYYKATTADGRSFGAPDVLWRVGRIVRDPAPAGSTLCERGLLHAATEPGESLVSHKTIVYLAGWRLFEVEPRDEIVVDADHPHKVGCRCVEGSA